MALIDYKTMKEIAEWNKKHPKEAKEFAKFHRELVELFVVRKAITYEEFKKRHEEWRRKHIIKERGDRK